MFRATVELDQHTDVEETLRHLEERAKSSHIEAGDVDSVLTQTRVVVQEFFDRGMSLVQTGSQMRASRTLEGPGYSIRINARFGIRESIWDRVVGFVGRRGRV